MSRIDPDNLLSISGDVNGDPPPPPPPPPPPSHPFVQQPLMAPQRQDVGPMLYSQAAFNRQGQNQPIVQHIPNAAATVDPAQPSNNVPAEQILPLVEYRLDGQTVYLLSAPTTVKAEPTTVKAEPTTVKTKKRKRVEQHFDGPCVKKPEQRPSYATKMTTSRSAVVNTILEQKGVKRKRDRSQAAKAATLSTKLAEASTSGEVTQQAKRLCVASVSTEVVEAPPTNRFVMELSNDVESFWLDSNVLAELKQLNTTVDKPVPPEIEALVSPAESDDELDDDLLEWAKEVEGLLAGLEEPDPQPWSILDL